MVSRIWRIFLLPCILLFFLLAAFTHSTQAFPNLQAGIEGIISQPDLSQFPHIKFNFEVYDPVGNFIADLQPEELRVVEDGVSIPLDALTRQEPGIRIILAYNPSSAFASPAPEGTYFSYIQKTLEIWAQNQPADTPNQLSIASNTGLHAAHLENPEDWQKAISSFQPEIYNTEASLVSLTLALDLASEPIENPGMRTAIFYITSLIPNNLLDALPDQMERARQANIPVFVWLVAPGATTGSLETEPFAQLANSSGGDLYVVSTREELPGLDNYLQPIRFKYEADYLAQVSQSGKHTLYLEGVRQGSSFTSSEVSFSLELQTPAPIFLTPPATIQRVWQENDARNQVLTPESITISYLVEFPDGYSRELQAASLFVNGELVVEDTAPPFEKFILPLEVYYESQIIQLQIEVVDILGLKQRSLQIPVIIEVDKSNAGLLKNSGSLLTILLAVAGLLLGVGMVFIVIRLQKRGKLPKIKLRKPAFRKGSKQPLKRTKAAKLSSKAYHPQRGAQTPVPREPVTRISDTPQIPVPKQSEKASRKDSKTTTLPEGVNKNLASAPARLVWLNDNSQKNQPLMLEVQDVIMGNDPRQVTHFIESPSLNPKHARFICTPDGSWYLSDLKTIAGTYVNYNPIGNQPLPLRHGDIVQLGTLAFRFEMQNPTENPRPKVESGQGMN